MKTCSRCRESKPLTDFYRNRAQPDGRCNQCIQCEKAYKAASPRAAAYRAEYWAKNRERLIAAHHVWRTANLDRDRETKRRWKERNRDKVRALARASAQRNIARYITYQRQWRRDNPLRHRLQTIRYRINKAGATGVTTEAQLKARMEYYGWRCYLCGDDLTLKTMTVDHRIPTSRNGTNWPANLAPACRACNSRKGNRTEREYRALHG